MSQIPILRAYDEVVDFFASGPTPEEIAQFHLSDETIARVRYLLYKKSSGTLTTDEADELDECVVLDRMVTLIRTKASKQLN